MTIADKSTTACCKSIFAVFAVSDTHMVTRYFADRASPEFPGINRETLEREHG